MSKAIGTLEDEVGVPMLERGARGVDPTEHGRILAEPRAAMLDELDQSLRSLAHLQDPTRGELRIGMPEPLMALAAGAIKRLSRRYPLTSFNIVNRRGVTLLRHLRDRAVDLVLSRLPSPDAAPVLTTEVLFHDALGVICGGDNKGLRRRNVRQPICSMSPGYSASRTPSSGPFVEEVFHVSGLPLRHLTVVTNSTHMRHCLFAGGRFLTIHPWAMVRLAGASGLLRLLPAELPVAARPICFVSLRKRAAVPLAGLFAAEVRLATQHLAEPTSRPRPRTAPRR